MFDRFCFDKRLKDCPFCGGEARLVARQTSTGAMAFVGCSYCKGQARAFQVNGSISDDDDFSDPAFQNAVRAWNQRAGV